MRNDVVFPLILLVFAQFHSAISAPSSVPVDDAISQNDESASEPSVDIDTLLARDNWPAAVLNTRDVVQTIPTEQEGSHGLVRRVVEEKDYTDALEVAKHFVRAWYSLPKESGESIAKRQEFWAKQGLAQSRDYWDIYYLYLCCQDWATSPRLSDARKSSFYDETKAKIEKLKDKWTKTAKTIDSNPAATPDERKLITDDAVSQMYSDMLKLAAFPDSNKKVDANTKAVVQGTPIEEKGTLELVRRSLGPEKFKEAVALASHFVETWKSLNKYLDGQSFEKDEFWIAQGVENRNLLWALYYHLEEWVSKNFEWSDSLVEGYYKKSKRLAHGVIAEWDEPIETSGSLPEVKTQPGAANGNRIASLFSIFSPVDLTNPTNKRKVKDLVLNLWNDIEKFRGMEEWQSKYEKGD